jgi:hypothetical protein
MTTNVWEVAAIAAVSALVGVFIGAIGAESLGLLREARIGLRSTPDSEETQPDRERARTP